MRSPTLMTRPTLGVTADRRLGPAFKCRDAGADGACGLGLSLPPHVRDDLLGAPRGQPRCGLSWRKAFGAGRSRPEVRTALARPGSLSMAPGASLLSG